MITPRPVVARPLIVWGVAAYILFAVVLAGRQIDADGVWFDEWWSLYSAGDPVFGDPLSPAGVWQRIATEDPWQIPGYFWLLAAWGNTIGWGEAAGRILSVLCGALLIAVTARLAGDLSRDGRVMIGAAAAAAGSGWLLFFMHELRTYTLYGLLAALAVLLYLRVMQRFTARRCIALFIVCAALIYTHYFAALIVGVIGLWHLVRAVRQRPDRRWGIVLAALIASGLPLLAWMANVLTAITLTQQAARFDVSGGRVFGIAADALYVFANAALPLFGLLLLAGLHRRRPGWWTTALFALTLTGAALIAYRVLAIGETRYLFGVLPFVAILAGYGMAALASRPALLAAVIAVWMIGGAVVEGQFEYRRVVQRTLALPLRDMARTLEGHTTANDVTVLHIGDEVLGGLQGHPFAHYFTDLPGRDEIVERATLPDLPAYMARVRAAIGDAGRVWTLTDPRWPSSQRALYDAVLLAEGIVPCTVLANAPDMHIAGWGRVNADELPARFADGRIAAGMIGSVMMQDGQIAAWIGFMQAADVPPETYSFSVQAVDASGTLIAAADAGLPRPTENGSNEAGDPLPGCRAVRLVAPPGSADDVLAGLDLRLVVYAWQTGERLPAADGSTDAPLQATP